MARRAGYAKQRKQDPVAQPAPRIETTADAEEALSVDEARERLTAAQQEAKDAEAKAALAKRERDAKIEQARRDVDTAAMKAKQAEHRAKADRLPALVAEQRQIEKRREEAAAAQHEATRQQYAARIKSWCRIIVQRQGHLNDVYGKNHERWEQYVVFASYEATPRHWPTALRMDLVKAAKIAVGLLDHCVRTTKEYVHALDLAKRCAQAGPPRKGNEFERQRELDMFVAVGEAGNGMNQFRDGVLDRPHLDWIEDGHVKQQDWALTESLARIFAEAARYDAGTTLPDDTQPIDAGRQSERAFTIEVLRQKAEHERTRRPIERQTHGAGMNSDPLARE